MSLSSASTSFLAASSFLREADVDGGNFAVMCGGSCACAAVYSVRSFDVYLIL